MSCNAQIDITNEEIFSLSLEFPAVDVFVADVGNENELANDVICRFE